MDRALYIAMSGAKQNMIGQTMQSNNLANLNTTGFRSDFAQARSMGVYYGDGHPTRAYSIEERPATDLRAGPAIETGRSMDLMIKGDGFIAVTGPDGRESYTRAGDLKIDPFGQLLTGNGLPVLGNGGPIAIPPFETLSISQDGTITIRALGQGAETLAEVDRIKLVNPNLQNLSKGEHGLMINLEEEIAPPAAEVAVVSGFLEGSNVNAIEAFTEVLSLSRQYEMQVKMMNTVNENSEASARLLQSN